MPEDHREGAHEAWRLALEHTYQEWSAATDPGTLQPKLKPTLKAAAEQLCSHLPVGADDSTLARLIESLEAPWGARIERQIREAMDTEEPAARSAAIARTVHELGPEPYQSPEPLSVIDRHEIVLVPWMALEVGE